MIRYKNESWVEKFRPKKLKEIISQENIISLMEGVLKSKNMPHFLFFGPSGCGKTSTILALTKELFTDEYFNERVIELNASDERGIKAVNDSIIHFCRKKMKINEDKYAQHKIVLLDDEISNEFLSKINSSVSIVYFPLISDLTFFLAIIISFF